MVSRELISSIRQERLRTDCPKKSDYDCGRLRRMATKKSRKTHTSSRKKASASTKGRIKQASPKASMRTAKSSSKRKLSETEWQKLQELHLKMAQAVYDDY